MDDIREYAKAYNEIFNSGLVNNEAVMKHVEEYKKIDEVLPNSASFFYIVEPMPRKYHFLGKQQESITGVDNESFIEGGVEGFIQRIHPEEASIVINEVYGDFFNWYSVIIKNENLPPSEIVFQYNYRFLNGNQVYTNIVEHIHILETNEEGIPALLLGNVITANNDKYLPVNAAIKVFRRGEVIETIYSKNYSENIAHYNLTNREKDILRNLASGKTSKQIGEQLYISPHTVDTHRRNLLKKLQCSSVVELTRIAFRHGLL